MEFREFALLLLGTVYAHLNKGQGVKQMFLDITEFEDPESNPIYNLSQSTCRGYLQKGHGISKIAGKIIAHLDEEKFENRIYNASDDAINILLEAFCEWLPDADSSNIGEKLAGEFERILKESASGNIRESLRGNSERDSTGCPSPELLIETNGRCPICGTPILGKYKAKMYEVVGITPLEAKRDYRIKREYEAAVPQMPALGSAQDKIVLCLECAADYKHDHSPKRFKEMVRLKAKMRAREELLDEISSINLEKDLPVLLARLGQVRDFTELETLRMDALKVRSKIAPENQLLALKIESIAAYYYNFISEQCQILESQGIIDFDLLAAQVRQCYLTLNKSGVDQESAYDKIRDWMIMKTGCERPVECEALVAFFVQNCKVFDALAE